MHIGFRKNKKQVRNLGKRITPLFLVYFFCMVFFFSLFKHVNQIYAVRNDTQQLIKNTLYQSTPFHILLAGIDSSFAKFSYSLSTLLTAYIENKSILPEYTMEIENILEYIANGGSIVTQKFFSHYPLSPLIEEAAGFSGDIISLLGEKAEQSYLIILQNTAESRPNGGFFGSFALIKIAKGQVTHLEILDSYLPEYDTPNTFITGPTRLHQFLPERQIYFVGANKVGFTYHDGAHIKTLYEKSYPGQKIRGVIFVRTDMFEKILPGFTEQQWEWQFVNASIDLIRGEERRGKKELYLKGSHEYFTEHIPELAKGLLDKLPELIKERYINIYLEDISGGLHTFLRQNNLTTRFEETEGYFWRSNTSFNKSDNFITKRLLCKNEQNTTSLESDKDIINLMELANGLHTCTLTYELDIPNRYIAYMKSLEHRYGVTLGDREKHILSMTYKRGTRGVMYLPKRIEIQSIEALPESTNIFETPFANAAVYSAEIFGQKGTTQITFTIHVKK